VDQEATRPRADAAEQAVRRQFGFTSRNTEKSRNNTAPASVRSAHSSTDWPCSFGRYVNMQWVWPASLQPASADDHVPTIYCLVPHSVLPLGCLSYAHRHPSPTLPAYPRRP
jgi:hypothetical protein